MFDFIDKGLDMIKDLAGSMADAIGDKIITAVSNFVGMVLYYITYGIMYVVGILQELFSVFAGITKVKYNGSSQYLINVFFGNTTINNIYWGMALLGITFVIAFTIIAVIRKSFDLGDKRQNQSMGSILGGMFKSILIMLLLTTIMSASLSISNAVIDRVSFIFDNADSFSEADTIRFTDEQYATMARIYKTIGNYSLNPSYASRYNLNSCYNELRPDLQYLQEQGVFDFVYVTKDKNGKTIDTWQSVLQELVYTNDPGKELKVNVYYDTVSKCLLDIMELLKTNKNFFPLSEYGREYNVTNSVGIDKILFLTGTTNAARNSAYNKNPYMTDGLRGAFFSGTESIYNYSKVKEAFDTGIGGINYILIWILAYLTLQSLFRCVFGCISRIFSMVSLYIVAPLTVASMPVDDGEKFKQWVTSMIVQTLGIFGTIIPMRLVILFAPIILNPSLSIFESTSLNFIAKTMLIVGGLKTVDGFGSIVTGILANNAGMQALRNNENVSKNLGDRAFGGLKSATGAVAKTGLKVAGYTAAAGAIGAGAVAVGGLAAAGLGIAGIGAGAYHGIKALTNLGGGVSESAQHSTGDAITPSMPKNEISPISIGDTAKDSGGMLKDKGIKGKGGTVSPADQMIEMQDLSGTMDDTDGTGVNETESNVPQQPEIGQQSDGTTGMDSGGNKVYSGDPGGMGVASPSNQMVEMQNSVSSTADLGKKLYNNQATNGESMSHASTFGTKMESGNVSDHAQDSMNKGGMNLGETVPSVPNGTQINGSNVQKPIVQQKFPPPPRKQTKKAQAMDPLSQMAMGIDPFEHLKNKK